MNLYEHQKKIISDDPKKTGLFLGTGSGKTRVALLLARGKTLVIAPKTQVEDQNWKREQKTILMEEALMKGTAIAKKLTVISKETFRRDHESLTHFDTVIVDEAHTCLGVTPNIRYRNKQAIPRASQLYEALEAFLERTKPERFYLCTATVIRNPMTVWAAARLLGKDWDFYKWRSTFYVRLPMPGREVWTPKNDSATKDRLAKAVQGLGYTGQLSDYFDVPDQTHKKIEVELNQKQKARIKDLHFEFPDPLVLVGKKHQVENGLLTGDEFNVLQFFDNAKLDILEDLAIEFPRIVIFAKYKAQIEQIRSRLDKLGKVVFTLTGDTKNRGNVLAVAKVVPEYIFVVQAQISAGWELPDCPVMVFASLDWSVVSYLQALGRIQRANNLKKNLYIHLVVKGGIDEHVYKSVMNKEDFNARIFLKL